MLSFRLATPGDEPYLRHCIEEAFSEFPRLLARGGRTIDEAIDLDLERLQDGFAIIAFEHEQIGAAWWLPSDEPNALTVAYFVEPNARGRGVATTLLEMGMEEAHKRGINGITIRTHPDNAASIALAKRVGFEPVVAILRRKL